MADDDEDKKEKKKKGEPTDMEKHVITKYVKPKEEHHGGGGWDAKSILAMFAGVIAFTIVLDYLGAFNRISTPTNPMQQAGVFPTSCQPFAGSVKIGQNPTPVPGCKFTITVQEGEVELRDRLARTVKENPTGRITSVPDGFKPISIHAITPTALVLVSVN